MFKNTTYYKNISNNISIHHTMFITLNAVHYVFAII